MMSNRIRPTLLALVALLLLAPATGEAKGVRSLPGGPLVQHVAGAGADTTANRQEAKWQVTSRSAETFMRRLEKVTGALPARNPPPTNGTAVTSTDYLAVNSEVLGKILGLPSRMSIQGSPIAPKIRIRQYLVEQANGKLVPGHKAGHTFVEIKMPHPTADRGTLKPRIVVPNALVSSLKDPAFMRDPKNVRKLFKKISQGLDAKGAKEAKLVLDVFGKLAASGNKAFTTDGSGRIATEVNIKYTRDAFQKDLKIDGKPLGIQFTFDRNITYDNARALTQSHRVVEVKIPNQFANKRVVDASIRAKKKQLRSTTQRNGKGAAQLRETISSLKTIKQIIGLQGYLSARQKATFAPWKGKFANRNNKSKMHRVSKIRQARLSAGVSRAPFQLSPKNDARLRVAGRVTPSAGVRAKATIAKPVRARAGR